MIASCTVPLKKAGSGAPKKTPSRTDKLLRHEVISNSSVTITELKNKFPELSHKVTTRTIPHRLQKDLGPPSRRTTKKPLLTAAMKKKRLKSCKKYYNWTSEKWKKVMFSYKSSSMLIRGGSKIVCCPSTVSPYNPKFTVTKDKRFDSVMVRGAFNGSKGTGGLYFLPKNVTMKAGNYFNVLEEHLLDFWGIHQCDYSMHDGTPAHKAKIINKIINDHYNYILE